MSLTESCAQCITSSQPGTNYGSGILYVSVSPPPFAAQFAEVEVDIETGHNPVMKLVMAVDPGVIVNPVNRCGAG